MKKNSTVGDHLDILFHQGKGQSATKNQLD